MPPTFIRERSGSNLGRHTGNSRWRFPRFLQYLKQMRGTAYIFHIPSNSSYPYQSIFMERVRSGEDDISWASQRIPCILWNQCVHYTRQQNVTGSYPQPINLIHAFSSHFFNTLFDFILTYF
jgi:hypothetical protein